MKNGEELPPDLLVEGKNINLEFWFMAPDETEEDLPPGAEQTGDTRFPGYWIAVRAKQKGENDVQAAENRGPTAWSYTPIVTPVQ